MMKRGSSSEVGALIWVEGGDEVMRGDQGIRGDQASRRCLLTHTHMHIKTNLYTYILKHTCMHAHKHTLIDILANTHTHTHSEFFSHTRTVNRTNKLR